MELEAGVVFRLANIKATFPPDSPKLHVGHLDLSDRDKERHPPLLSVFEGRKTSVEQAAAIRGVSSESAAYGFRVDEIRRIQVEGLQGLRVVRDPLDPPECDLPGADGHCGIEGLYRPPGQSKQQFRELRVLLADKSFKYYDGMS